MVSRTGSKKGMSIIRPDALICLRVLLVRYDPRSITTEGGNLKITLTNSPQKGLNYTGGLMSTWNKFCFRGGYIESESMAGNVYTDEYLTYTSAPFVLSSQPRFAWYKLCLRVSPDR